MNSRNFFTGAITGIVAFTVLARGAHDLWAATVVALALSLVLVAFLVWGRELQWTFAPLPFLVIIGALFLSFWGAFNKSEAVMALKDILASLLLFFIAANVFRKDQNWSFFLACLVPVLWIQAGLSLTQRPLHELSTRFGTLINANLEAAFLLAWFPALLDRFLTATGAESKMRWYWLSGTVAAAIAFVLTWSVSAWVVLTFILVVWSRQMGVRWKFLLGLVTVAGIGLLIFKWEASESVVNRLAWWKTALNMFLAHPWTGVGLGNYPSAFLAYRVRAGENTLSPHSWFFQIVSEMGLGGLMLLVLLAYLILKALTTFHERSHLQKSLVLGSAAVMLYSLVNVGAEYLVIRLLVPLLLVPLTTPTVRSFRPRWSVILLSFGAVIFSLPFLLSPFLASRHQVTGQIYLANADIDQAEKSFQIAADLDPLQWESRRELARIWYDRSMFRQDKELFDKAIAMQKEAIRLNGLNGRLWWELGHYAASHGTLAPEAETYFQKAHDLGFIFSSSLS